MQHFDVIWRQAAQVCGEAALRAALPPPVATESVRALADHRCLAAMTRCVFEAGFSAAIIAARWADFENAFHGFEPTTLATLDDRQWAAYCTDARIVRNHVKVAAVRDNCALVRALAIEHGGVGRFVASWPTADFVGLLALLKRRGGRLGGLTGQRLLARLGVDGFLLDRAVVSALKSADVPGASRPASAPGLASVQAAFNHWHQESGLTYRQLTIVLARGGAGCAVG